jgi:hypothetical protein
MVFMPPMLSAGFPSPLRAAAGGGGTWFPMAWSVLSDCPTPPRVTRVSFPPCRPHTPWCDRMDSQCLRPHTAGSTISCLWPNGSSWARALRLRPGGSPHALRIPPRGGHPALRLGPASQPFPVPGLRNLQHCSLFVSKVVSSSVSSLSDDSGQRAITPAFGYHPGVTGRTGLPPV